MKSRYPVLLAVTILPLTANQGIAAEFEKAAVKPSALVSLACSVTGGPGQPTTSFSTSRGVPAPTSGNCSDDVIGYINQGFRIRSTFSTGTGGIVYILIK